LPTAQPSCEVKTVVEGGQIVFLMRALSDNTMTAQAEASTGKSTHEISMGCRVDCNETTRGVEDLQRPNSPINPEDLKIYR
jgi:hypothetical protein